MDRNTSCNIYRVLTVLFFICVGFCCFSTMESMHNIQFKVLVINKDKLVHFIMFLPFPFLAFHSLKNRGDRPWKSLLILVCIYVCGAVISGTTEIIQGFLPYRSKDFYDFVADLTGLLTGTVLTLPCINWTRK